MREGEKDREEKKRGADRRIAGEWGEAEECVKRPRRTCQGTN